ncbi:MAG: ATP-binding cassette domain-containing protein [Treponema sp.]|nr:ATP-binding cassette domain-containing protein [Treponema sp.]
MTLELRDICLKYSHKTVLQNLNLNWAEGQLHALLGENGAGKSTAANIICGELKQDSGQLILDGKCVSFATPKAAIEHGICYVHQTPMLADSISVKENLLLGIKKEYQKNIIPVTQKWLNGIDPRLPAKELTGGLRFFAALCSALIKNPKLLILDEPSALLDDEQRTFLFEGLRELALGGMNIIIITHNYDEAEAWCDTIDFLEDGRLIEKKRLASLTAGLKNKPHKALMQSNLAGVENTLVFNNLNAQPQNGVPVYNISFSVEKGKITLIQGLAQDGLSTLEELVTKRKKLPMRAGIIPTDRKYTASNPNLTVEQMLTAALDIAQNQRSSAALKMIKNAGVNITPYEKCKNLSGGMLQKLLIERELYNSPELLVLCNPLQGLDPDTCAKACERIKQEALNGAYVLILSFGAFPPQFSDFHYELRNGKLEAV